MVRNHPQDATADDVYRDHRLNRPQDPFDGTSNGPGDLDFNELIEEVALTFDNLLFEEPAATFGEIEVDEIGRLTVFDNEVVEEVSTVFDDLVGEQIPSTFNPIGILETAP